MKIGITFGCYIPLHKGHLSLINKAIKENDKVIIGVCGFDEDRGKNFIPFRTRYILVKNKYKDFNNIKVILIDDHKLLLDGTFTLENWKLWCKELFDNAQVDPLLNEITWYTGENNYVDKISILYPNHSYFIADRNKINISGTKIRENPDKYKDFIDSYFYKYLNKEYNT